MVRRHNFKEVVQSFDELDAGSYLCHESNFKRYQTKKSIISTQKMFWWREFIWWNFLSKKIKKNFKAGAIGFKLTSSKVYSYNCWMIVITCNWSFRVAPWSQKEILAASFCLDLSHFRQFGSALTGPILGLHLRIARLHSLNFLYFLEILEFWTFFGRSLSNGWIGTALHVLVSGCFEHS